jgi:sodium/potassium-transporting ATPase subunit alpha
LISGDHPVTACALAKRLTIFSPESETVEDVAIKLGVPVERVGPRYELIFVYITKSFLFV